ncbi:MAG: hypothetical protein M9945_05660 [Aquamicrobium sp.]|uniref:hypothetical protein n=1 Tax=Aquamicrobium sp. TaxID=1872579 RepID=UPI00349EB63F|nr:hypothetical protein [Aquamicrobium sp.]
MATEPRFHLTTRDHAILQALFDAHRGPHGPYLLLLEQKLRGSALAFSDDIPADVVTLDSSIAYTVDGVLAGPHALVEDDAPDDAVSVLTLRGLALLGLREGSAVTVDLGDGVSEVVRVVKVLSQPEAAARSSADAAGTSTADAGGGAVVRFRPRAARPTFPDPGPDDDDPGPRAA